LFLEAEVVPQSHVVGVDIHLESVEQEHNSAELSALHCVSAMTEETGENGIERSSKKLATLKNRPEDKIMIAGFYSSIVQVKCSQPIPCN
jgi:hypothetical protein